jgi:hypothetical protein
MRGRQGLLARNVWLRRLRRDQQANPRIGRCARPTESVWAVSAGSILSELFLFFVGSCRVFSVFVCLFFGSLASNVVVFWETCSRVRSAWDVLLGARAVGFWSGWDR